MESTMDRFLNFCGNTSLHGWKFVYRETGVVRWFWFLVNATSLSAAVYLVTYHTIHFSQANVRFELKALTEPLDKVFFPSAVICSSNALRQSFLTEYLQDPLLQNYSRSDLFEVMERTFIRGRPATKKDNEIIQAIFKSETYERNFQDFLDFNGKDIISPKDKNRFINVNTDLYLWHDVQMTINITEENEDDIKLAVMNEIATQFREGEMMPSIEFNGWGVFYETGFSTDLSETCTWITPYVKESHDPQMIRFSQPYCKMGTNNGLLMLLDAETFDYASTPISSTNGFVISILHGLDVPIMKQSGIRVSAGQSVQIAVTPTLISTSEEARRRFTPNERTCYFEDEVSLKHFPFDHDYRYEMSNCIFEATLQQIEKDCGCTPKNFIDVIDDYVICTGQAKECMNRHMRNMGDFRTIVDKDGKKKPCLAACSDQTYDVFVSQSEYPNANTFKHSDHFCIAARKLKRSCNNSRRPHLDDKYPDLCRLLKAHSVEPTNTISECQLAPTGDGAADDRSAATTLLEAAVTRYAAGNMAFVTVFIRNPYVAHYQRDEAISEVAFASNIGGLMGLFLGFSFISVVEVFYLCCRMNKKKRDRDTDPTGDHVQPIRINVGTRNDKMDNIRPITNRGHVGNGEKWAY